MSGNNATGSQRRLWDHRRRRPSKKQRQATMAREPVPFITIQGQRYYSDRFYINRTIHDEDDSDYCCDDDEKNNKSGTGGCRVQCTCGAQATSASPSPSLLFDRAKLVESLDLKAAILATYTLAPSWLMQHEFPSLLGPHSTVPTLVLHGQKGWSHPNQKPRRQEEEEDDDDDTTGDDSMDHEDFIVTAAATTRQGCAHVDLSNMPPQLQQPGETKRHNNNSKDGIHKNDDESDDDDDDVISFGTQPDETCAPVPLPTTAASVAQQHCREPTKAAAVATATTSISIKNTTKDSNNDGNDEISKKKGHGRPYQHDEHQQQQQQQQRRAVPLSISTCPSHVHWTKVLPCWMPLQELPFLHQQQQQQNGGDGGDDDTSFTVSQAIVDKRKSKRGVHHPKFMLLFEQSGSLVVVVSTANMTPSCTTDASWVQRFYPFSASATTTTLSTGAAMENENNTIHGTNSNTTASPSSSSTPTNDFGLTLAHLLQCQTWATKQGDWTPAAFCQKYLGFDQPLPQQQQQQQQPRPDQTSFSNAFRNLYKGYDFSTAQVHLVSHVPGDYPMPSSSSSSSSSPPSTSTDKHEKNSTYNPTCFGRMRVAEILQRLSPSPDGSSSNSDISGGPWLNKCIVSSKDQLILQPTSFGANWTPSNMADVVQSYLQSTLSPFQDPNDADQEITTPNVSDWLQRTDIVWPTDDFMQAASSNLEANGQRQGHSDDDDGDSEQEDHDDDRISPTSAMTMGFAPRLLKAQTTADGENNNNNDGDSCDGDDVMMVGNGTRDDNGIIFLSSATFNNIHMDCLSRMVMFEPSHPPPRKATLPPHFKSIARHYRGQDHRLMKDYAMGKSQDCFSWFLLTSACLSLGAQGERSSTSRKKSSSSTSPSSSGETISFSNFELGVLFVSRLQGRPQSDRLYCCKPVHCTCAEDSKMGTPSKLIHLPVPFSFRPNRYQADPEEMEFCETPYFNEIPNGTAGVGNMMFTPYGAQVAYSLDQKG